MSAVKARFKPTAQSTVRVDIDGEAGLLTLFVEGEEEVVMTADEVLLAIKLLQESIA